jgi:hypothetical protein
MHLATLQEPDQDLSRLGPKTSWISGKRVPGLLGIIQRQ